MLARRWSAGPSPPAGARGGPPVSSHRYFFRGPSGPLPRLPRSRVSCGAAASFSLALLLARLARLQGCLAFRVFIRPYQCLPLAISPLPHFFPLPLPFPPPPPPRRSSESLYFPTSKFSLKPNSAARVPGEAATTQPNWRLFQVIQDVRKDADVSALIAPYS